MYFQEKELTLNRANKSSFTPKLKPTPLGAHRNILLYCNDCKDDFLGSREGMKCKSCRKSSNTVLYEGQND